MDYYKRLIIYLILLAVITLLVVAFFVGIIIAHLRITPVEITLNECFTRQVNMPHYPDTYVLGIEVDETFYKIIECESNFRPEVCSYAGCEAGMGLCQIIPSTLRYCEEKLGRELDPFNPEDNLACGIWLYENEGTRHWLPSEECWNN